ncbi:hypothetical protein [Nonomuraea sp. NPDC049141]|uniref:hypothetical protein n=1 Tax=Nonomuraea sp. NPDC049141 TaxID=3155500 RepID=UPI00340208C8
MAEGVVEAADEIEGAVEVADEVADADVVEVAVEDVGASASAVDIADEDTAEGAAAIADTDVAEGTAEGAVGIADKVDVADKDVDNLVRLDAVFQVAECMEITALGRGFFQSVAAPGVIVSGSEQGAPEGRRLGLSLEVGQELTIGGGQQGVQPVIAQVGMAVTVGGIGHRLSSFRGR